MFLIFEYQSKCNRAELDSYCKPFSAVTISSSSSAIASKASSSACCLSSCALLVARTATRHSERTSSFMLSLHSFSSAVYLWISSQQMCKMTRMQTGKTLLISIVSFGDTLYSTLPCYHCISLIILSVYFGMYSRVYNLLLFSDRKSVG